MTFTYNSHSLGCLNKAVNRINDKVSTVCIKLRLELSSVSYRVCRSLALVLQPWISALGMLKICWRNCGPWPDVIPGVGFDQ